MEWLLGGLRRDIADLTRSIRTLAMSNRRPLVWVRLTFQEHESMALIYTVTAGAPVDRDVVARELTVIVNGEASGEPRTYPGSATDLGEVRVEQDANVVLALVDVDDAGNRSQPATVEFTATDTIPPAQPGAFGVQLVREQ